MTKRERKARAKALKAARRTNIALIAGGLLAAIITIPVMNYYSTPERIRNCPSDVNDLQFLSHERAVECYNAVDYPLKLEREKQERQIRRWERGE